jgi:hypothetical protein
MVWEMPRLRADSLWPRPMLHIGWMPKLSVRSRLQPWLTSRLQARSGLRAGCRPRLRARRTIGARAASLWAMWLAETMVVGMSQRSRQAAQTDEYRQNPARERARHVLLGCRLRGISHRAGGGALGGGGGVLRVEGFCT